MGIRFLLTALILVGLFCATVSYSTQVYAVTRTVTKDKSKKTKLGSSPSQTTLIAYNASSSPVTVYITLGADSNTYFVQDVSSINFVAKPASPPVTISGSGLVGTFTLAAGQQAAYTTPAGYAVSGRFTFGAPASLCPTGENPNGVNIAEFTLNTNTDNFTGDNFESLDISCVNGVNCKLVCKMTGGGNWATTPTNNNPQNPNNQNVTKFGNADLLGGPSMNVNLNAGLVGVYPPGCDDCTSSVNPGCAYWTTFAGTYGSSPYQTCEVTRNATTSSGGTVKFSFIKLYPTTTM